MPLGQTPDPDRLAGEGTRFTRAYTTASVCSASGSAFMTAMCRTGIGAHQHRTDPKLPLPDGAQVVTQYFHWAGYFTTNCNHGSRERSGKTDFNSSTESAFDGTDWRQRPAGRPFFSIVNFAQTHRPFTADPSNPVDPAAAVLPRYYPDHRVTRLDWALDLEAAQVLDRKVGGVLERLERMRGELDAWMDATTDQGRTPEDPRVAARVLLERHQPAHQRVMEGRGPAVDPSPAEYLAWRERWLEETKTGSS